MTDYPPEFRGTERRRQDRRKEDTRTLTVEEVILSNSFDLVRKTDTTTDRVYLIVKVVAFLSFIKFCIIIALVLLVSWLDDDVQKLEQQVRERDAQIDTITEAVDDIQRIARRFETLIDDTMLE